GCRGHVDRGVGEPVPERPRVPRRRHHPAARRAGVPRDDGLGRAIPGARLAAPVGGARGPGMTVVEGAEVVIGTDHLALDELVAIANAARVRIGEDAWRTIEASRAIVDRVVDGPALVYGLNTGLGH